MDLEKIPKVIKILVENNPGSPITKTLLQQTLKVGVPDSARTGSAELLAWLSEQEEPQHWLGVTMGRDGRSLSAGVARLENFTRDGISVDVAGEHISFEGTVRIPVYYTQTIYNTVYIPATVDLDISDVEGRTTENLIELVADRLIDEALGEDLSAFVDFSEGDSSGDYGEVEACTHDCEVDEWSFDESDVEDLVSAVEEYVNQAEDEEE